MRGLCALPVLLLACTNPIDRTDNRLPSADGDVVDAGGADSGLPQCLSCLEVGQRFAYTRLTLESLDGKAHPAIPILNALWAADFERSELNVLWTVTAIADGHVHFRGENGVRVAGQTDAWCIKPETAIPFDFIQDSADPCRLVVAEPAGINVYTGTTEIPKNCAPDGEPPNIIPVRNVQMSVRVTNDCQALIEGQVESAAISASAIDDVCTCVTGPSALAEQCGGLDPDYTHERCGGCGPYYQNLRALMTVFGELAMGCQTEDGEPAVCMEASFEAERLEETPQNCP